MRSDDATLLSNRSAAFLCVGHSENALDDATRCVKLRPNWGKAHGRHGAALAALGCTHDAVLAYERGVKLTPDSAPMRTELSRLRTLLEGEERERERRAKEEAAAEERQEPPQEEEEEEVAEEPPSSSAGKAAEEAASGGSGSGGGGGRRGKPAPRKPPPDQPPAPPRKPPPDLKKNNTVNADDEVVLGGGAKYTRVANVDELQAQGTEAFKLGEYETAMEKWSVALKRRPEDPTLLSNRSAAWLALGERQKALDDAAKCVSVSPEWYKGHGRVGAALAALGRLDEAMASVSKGLELNPESQVLSSELERLKGEASAAGRGPLPGLGDGSGGGGDGGGEGDEGGGGGGAQVALVGLALAKECNRLGRPEQAIRELDKLLSNKVADAELYCERALAHNKTHQLALAVQVPQPSSSTHTTRPPLTLPLLPSHFPHTSLSAVQDAATAVYLYEHQHDPELKPWENPKELGIKLMTRQQKNELAKKEGYAFLLRGEAETRLCDYDKVRANTLLLPSPPHNSIIIISSHTPPSPTIHHSPSPVSPTSPTTTTGDAHLPVRLQGGRAARPGGEKGVEASVVCGEGAV